MKKLFWISTIALFGLFACNTNEESDSKAKFVEKITTLEQGAFNDQTLEYNKDTSLTLIKEYQSYIEQYPEDSLSKKYSYMSAQLNQSVHLYGEAIRKYKAFCKKYPKDERTPKAHIIIGMLYESELKDPIKAKEAYELFLEKYPEHEMAKDVEMMIQYLSLSDQELMDMLKAKSQGQN